MCLFSFSHSLHIEINNLMKNDVLHSLTNYCIAIDDDGDDAIIYIYIYIYIYFGAGVGFEST